MVDVREVITEAIPCNIVYGRPQAAGGIISAITTAGFRILGPGEVDQVTVEKCAEIAEKLSETWSNSRDAFQAVQEAAASDKAHEIAAAIRAIGRKA